MAGSLQQIGRRGEDIAAAFFVEQGYEVADRNWRCALGEVDVVARKGDEWRFVEVKLRTSLRFGYPEEAVTSRKRRHTFAAMQYYMDATGLREDQVHLDVLAILEEDGKTDIQWFRDAC